MLTDSLTLSIQSEYAPTSVNTVGALGYPQTEGPNDIIPTSLPAITAGPPASCCEENHSLTHFYYKKICSRIALK